MTRKISRRDFFRSGAAVAAAGVLAGCQPGARRWVVLEPYVRPPEERLDGVATFYASACRQCSAGCGIIVRVMNGRAVKIEGNPEYPLNRGKLCAQGQAGLQMLYNPDRITKPQQTKKAGSGDFTPVPWDSAVSVVSGELKNAGNGVAILGVPAMSGHLYALFSLFAQAVGAPPPVIWDLSSTWAGESSVAAANNQLLGQNDLPAYNLASADVILSFGNDWLGQGLSPTRYNMEYGGFRTQGKGLRGYLIHFEPHQSLTAAKADLWVPARPGYTGLLAQAIARIIADQKYGSGDVQTRMGSLAGSVDVNATAEAAGVGVETLNTVARIYAEAAHPVAVAANGLGGPNDVAAVQALNIIGNNVVSSANPPVGDLKRPSASSYADMQKLIAQMNSGAVKVLMIYGANPVYDLPGGANPADNANGPAGFQQALSKVGYVVSFNSLIDETTEKASMVLPDRSYLESWGYTVTAPNWGMPMVTSQQPIVQPLDDARSTGDVLIALAKQVPAAAGQFPWPDEVTYLKEVIAKLPPGAYGGSGQDVQWARFLQHGGWWPAEAPAPAAPRAITAGALNVGQPQFQGDAAQFPYYLYPFVSTPLGVGAGANVPWLQGSPEPLTSISWQTWVAINPTTAQKLGVTKGDVVEVSTPNGQVQAPVYVYNGIREDTIGIPLGQGHTALGRYAENNGVNAITLLGMQAGPGGNEPAWSAVRCQVRSTGTKVTLATFENTYGVEQGFANKGFPGE